MDDALKTQIIDTVEDTYLCEMRHKYTGYLGVKTRDLLDHLLDRYGKITAADLAACQIRMNEPINVDLPIDVYFQKIDECVQYAVDGKVAYTLDQILQTAYHAISASGFYNDACKDWRKKPAEQKTWETFKRFFASEYHDLKEQQRVNTSTTSFHSANAAIDVSTALENLAMAASADRNIVEHLTNANEQLTATNKLLVEQVQTLVTTNAQLTSKLNNTTQRAGGGKPPYDRATFEASLDPMGYCWTHGYRVTTGHNSKTCKGKLQGHQDTATRADTQGGSTKGKN